jgi:hypothetical protein
MMSNLTLPKNIHLTHFLLSAVVFCLTCMAYSLTTCAQDLDEVTISGRVSDENGANIPGATITATLLTTDLERVAVTDEAGLYRFVELAPGEYRLRASIENFAPVEKTDLITIAGQNVQLNFTLRPAAIIAEQIIVTEADATTVDTTRTIVGGTITSREIEALPNVSRSPLDFVFALGGITEEPFSTRDLSEDRPLSASDSLSPQPEEAGVFALSGGTAYSNNITIDGFDNNDDRAARERFQPSIEAIEEVQVIRNQFSAEYGRASGGRVNLRTRGGSNQYRGRAFYFFRDEALNANTFRNNLRGLKRLPLQEHNAGFNFSGPLQLPKYNGRQRTFFFTNYEYQTTLDTALIDTLVPVEQSALFRLPQPTDLANRRFESADAPAEIAPFVDRISTPVKNHIFTARLDHKFSDAHNGTLLYQLGRARNLRGFGGGNRLAEALLGRTRNTAAIAYSDNQIFSARTVNQTRVQFSRLTPAVDVINGAMRSPVILISIKDSRPEGDPERRSGTLIAGSSTSGALDRKEERWQLQDALSYVRGAHTWKFGADVQRIHSSFIDLADISGTFNFDSARDFVNGAPSRFRQNFQTISEQHNTYTGAFVQDEWRSRQNLTISYGLRYENESIIKDRNNFGPRIGIAYDPFKSGKTVIRFGAGIFYNRALLRTVDDFTLGRQQLIFDTDALINPLTRQRMTTTERRAFIAANLRFPRQLSVDDPLVKQYGLLNTNFARRLDSTLRIPESYQTNLGFEREIGKAFVFEANYAWNRGLHLWREFNANAPRLPEGFENFTQYLLSRDFPNFRVNAVRPIYDASTAGDLVRFALTSSNAANPNAIQRIVINRVPITIFNLNSTSSTTTLNAAANAVNNLRPNPMRGQIEQLASIGNSFYHGLTIELRRRFFKGKRNLSFSFRAAYTLSRLIDDGIVNTSSALRVGDFRGERARSLLDRRHRFVFSGTFAMPARLGAVRFSPVLRVASGAPFNISIGGVDRNLDDVGNDRPIFTGDRNSIRHRNPGETLNAELVGSFALPTIGSTGNLPRNAGHGPRLFLFDLNIERTFRLAEDVRLRPVIEFDNLLNKTVFNFGTEFINFTALSQTATPAQRQAFQDSFLVPTRTLRPRMIRVGLRLDF